MKKIIWTLSALGLTLTMTACGDDEPKRYCDTGFKGGCQGGEWLQCSFEEADNDGRGLVVAKETVDIDDREYICNDDNVLVPNCTCQNGNLVDNKDGSVSSAICNSEGNIYSCNGEEIVIKNGSYCDNGTPMVCQNGQLVESVCGANGEIYSCDGDKVVVNDNGAYCNNGTPMVCQNGQLVETLCGANGEIYTCDDNNTIAVKFSYCNDQNQTVKCMAGLLQASSCDDRVCEEYERAGSIYAGCFKSEDVENGCDADVKPYGVCDDTNNILKFCTSSDPSIGKTIELKCGDTGETCMLVEKLEYGYDCVYTCKDNNNAPHTDRGYCEGTTLHWCEPTNDAKTEYTYMSYDCANNTSGDNAGKLSCGFNKEYFDCK